MNGKYIKFEEGNVDSLNKAKKLAETLGYGTLSLCHGSTTRFLGTGILYLRGDLVYFISSNNEEYFISKKYEEVILGD